MQVNVKLYILAWEVKTIFNESEIVEFWDGEGLGGPIVWFI